MCKPAPPALLPSQASKRRLPHTGEGEGRRLRRAAAKIAAILHLYERGYSPPVIAALSRVLDRLLTLPRPANVVMWQEVKKQQEAKNMMYMTYPEEQAVGVALHGSIIDVVASRFANADVEAITAAISQITDIATLRDLLVKTATAPTLDEVRRAIASATAQPSA